MAGTIILFSPIHWYSTWQAPHDLTHSMTEAGFEVIFIEPIPKRWPGIEEAPRIWGRLIGNRRLAGHSDQIKPPEPVKLISPICAPDTNVVARGINRLVFFSKLIDQINSISANNYPTITINFVPIYGSLDINRRIHHDVSIYWSASDWQNHPFINQKNIAEDKMLDFADLVIADASFLYERFKELHSNVHLFPPSVQQEFIDYFINTQHDKKPSEVRVGYFGTVGKAIDTELLRKVSHAYPLKIIGAVRADLQGFDPKTEFIEAVPHTELPQHLMGVDVLILPYNPQAKHIKGVIPAKTMECLATGLPSVVYGLESLEVYCEYFYLCESHEQFLEAIQIAASEVPGRKESRVSFAQKNTSASRVEKLIQLCQQVIEKQSSL